LMLNSVQRDAPSYTAPAKAGLAIDSGESGETICPVGNPKVELVAVGRLDCPPDLRHVVTHSFKSGAIAVVFALAPRIAIIWSRTERAIGRSPLKGPLY
jgi:hypothetical protein